MTLSVQATPAAAPVRSATAPERVVAAASTDHVGARTSAHEVVATEADHSIVSAPGGDHVVALRPPQLVGVAGADDRRHLPGAGADGRPAVQRVAYLVGLGNQEVGVRRADLVAALAPDLNDEPGELLLGRPCPGSASLR